MRRLNILFFFLALFTLTAILLNFSRVQMWFLQASGEPANLVVDTDSILGFMTYPWQNLSQGGESASYRFLPAMEHLQALKPQYIRLDHLYDFYDVVSREDGQLQFDWQKFDLVLTDIASAGAKPFLSLSYMPEAISKSDMLDVPENWDDWALVVQKTIEHVSGKDQLNLSDVYYEVWNEPDLFGKWKTYGAKNYLTLYDFAAQGATRARNAG